eukprot:gnl/TRDRNA2_/TRDRNA2_135995_c0_seq1.p1 gnl/TRDRNA2_/TRDRNA2_135995_c0~~gnl/TRDRNA2_/TRDRNA2_135995_c0_seq1.p1  ORF type:complete len:415 (+),score=28.02 gnl/TRDRNA2_/TRDRNA2_135995_c0_seq1:189-1247(+)
MLHKQSLDGHSLKLASLEVGDAGESVLEQNASTGVVDVRAQLKIDQLPPVYNLQGSKWMKSEACSLVLEPGNITGSIQSSMVFRHGTTGLPPLTFELCEPYICEAYEPSCDKSKLLKWRNFSDVAAFKANFMAQSSSPFVAFDSDRSTQMVCMVLLLVGWALFKLAGVVAELYQISVGEADFKVKAAKWVVFTAIPAHWLSPWTSLHVHEDCPQLAVWLLPLRHEVYMIVVGMGILMLLLLYVFLPVAACLGKEEAVVGAAGLLAGLMAFVQCVIMAVEIFFAFPRLPSFPIQWHLLFDFSWPEYSLAWTTSWLRLFAFLIFAWECAGQGLLQKIVLKIMERGYKSGQLGGH